MPAPFFPVGAAERARFGNRSIPGRADNCRTECGGLGAFRPGPFRARQLARKCVRYVRCNFGQPALSPAGRVGRLEPGGAGLRTAGRFGRWSRWTRRISGNCQRSQRADEGRRVRLLRGRPRPSPGRGNASFAAGIDSRGNRLRSRRYSSLRDDGPDLEITSQQNNWHWQSEAKRLGSAPLGTNEGTGRRKTEEPEEALRGAVLREMRARKIAQP